MIAWHTPDDAARSPSAGWLGGAVAPGLGVPPAEQERIASDAAMRRPVSFGIRTILLPP